MKGRTESCDRFGKGMLHRLSRTPYLMPRLPRYIEPGAPLHHVVRGNNRGPVFHDDCDRQLYCDLLLQASRRFECQVHAYVLMTNHTHLLLTPTSARAASLLTQWLGRKYVAVFNKRHGRSGTLWEGRFHSSVIGSERYFLSCSRYVDQNPVRAGLVRSAEQYRWSSYLRLAYGYPDALISEHPVYHALGSTPRARQRAYRELCTPPLDSDTVSGIRRAVRRGSILGLQHDRHYSTLAPSPQL